eukprot:CAMPEP_0201664614 /NCGR_PEP_ID=MMETSP0494-20130426/6017_1 /ASSEMBLY_ACC=CAM_ASM_000839 /TAXON_ID=420259 /ORGANISM="Thalassiosira gravida, Strain GMp14c1" /LENGTH=850 /DNA_ID=CAMNT_0048143409 /DNA_START=174 /DNA_END=2726 /DNA_ORIENTATION=+
MTVEHPIRPTTEHHHHQQQQHQSKSTLEEEEAAAALTLLDAFDFDPNSMPNIIDIDVVDNHHHNHNHQRPSSRNSNTTFNSNTTIATADDNADAITSNSMPFIMMLGDYSEKEYFVPSTNVIRNEILEGVSCSEVDGGDDGNSSGSSSVSSGSCKLTSVSGSGIAFRCIYCKHVKDPVEMSVIRPHNLASIRESVLHFQQTHVQQCTYIPNDIRTCYLNFKSQEESFVASATSMATGSTIMTTSTSTPSSDDEENVWVSSAIRRGLRDIESGSSGSGSGSRNQGGGILYCPELAVHELEPSRQRVVGYHPPNPNPSSSSSSSSLSSSSESIVSNLEEEEPRPNDVLIGRGGLAVKHPGNIYWRQLMKEVKSDYLDCHRRSKYHHHHQQQQPDNTLTTNDINIDSNDNNNNGSKSKKSILTSLVVETIRNQFPTPGRFLFQDKVTGKWNDIGDKEAMKKTRQALRDMGKQARLQQHQHYQQRHAVDRNDVGGDVVATASTSSSSAFEYASATTATATTSTKVKSESRKRTNDGLLTLKPHADVIVVDNATTTQEKNEGWEITNLFNEEIGEWVDTTTTDEPTNLPPTKKKQKLESTASKSNNNFSFTVLDKSSNNNEVDCWKMLQETLTDIASFHNHDHTIATKENKLPNTITTTINNNKNNNNTSSSISSKCNNTNNKSKGVVSKSKISKAINKGCHHKKHHEAKMSKPIKKVTVPTSSLSSSTSSPSIVKFNGVSKISKAKGHKYEARFSSVRLGSYVLKADAALAYDGYVRSSGRKKHFGKINFQVESDYLVARELELEGRGLGNIANSSNGGSTGSSISLKSIDLEDTLEYISTKVNNAVEKTRHRA